MRHFSQASGAPGLGEFALVVVVKLLQPRSRISYIKTPRTSRKDIETLRHVRAQKEKTRMIRKCKNCDIEFDARTTWQLFHDQACKWEWHNKQRKKPGKQPAANQPKQATTQSEGTYASK